GGLVPVGACPVGELAGEAAVVCEASHCGVSRNREVVLENLAGGVGLLEIVAARPAPRVLGPDVVEMLVPVSDSLTAEVAEVVLLLQEDALLPLGLRPLRIRGQDRLLESLPEVGQRHPRQAGIPGEEPVEAFI